MIQSSVNQIIGTLTKTIEPQAQANEVQSVAPGTPQPEVPQLQPQNVPVQVNAEVPKNKEMENKAMSSVTEKANYEIERDKRFKSLLDEIKNAGRHGKGQSLYNLKKMAEDIEKENK